jgi:hypothetical protein
MQHTVEDWCSVALEITTEKITTAKVGGAVRFRDVYYHIRIAADGDGIIA